MAKPKEVTREQAARKKSQAAAFMERIGQPDRAAEFESMSVEDYAEHKGLRLTNPHRRRIAMPQPSGPTKVDLQDTIDSATVELDDCLREGRRHGGRRYLGQGREKADVEVARRSLYRLLDAAQCE